MVVDTAADTAAVVEAAADIVAEERVEAGKFEELVREFVGFG